MAGEPHGSPAGPLLLRTGMALTALGLLPGE
jgi:hypothetical protein